jgi:hypothetical protein
MDAFRLAATFSVCESVIKLTISENRLPIVYPAFNLTLLLSNGLLSAGKSIESSASLIDLYSRISNTGASNCKSTSTYSPGLFLRISKAVYSFSIIYLYFVNNTNTGQPVYYFVSVRFGPLSIPYFLGGKISRSIKMGRRVTKQTVKIFIKG